MRFLIITCFVLFSEGSIIGQCDPVFSPPLSPRIANYEIKVRLDHHAKTARATETLTWVNTSPDTLRELRFYMYLNAFKNTETTFLKGSGGNVFGEDVSDRPDGTWGWIQMDSIGVRGGADLTAGQRYIQPDDGNINDQSVLSVPLKQPLLPGQTVVLDIRFSLKMPKTIVRSGYSKDDFFLFVHWFPQMGVYEQNLNGQWGWNCHQFFRQTEFYSDFGNYDVEITTAEPFVVGASGCLMAEKKNPDGTVARRYRVEDVIDFAWVAYPLFEVFEDQWEGVAIRLLIPPEHAALAPRYLTAVKQSLAYLSEHVGPYPYPVITVVDPPLHALRSGMMEYPTLITGGSFYAMPAGIRTVESLAVHEFVHQYFMGMVATNEKEEAWLDEGFATYFEDRIIDHYYGAKRSLINIFGFRTDNKELTRLEYTRLPNPRVGSGARPGWEINEGYKGLVYSKTATTLQTLQGLVGAEMMDFIIKMYFDRWKFKHPRGQDFLNVVEEAITIAQNPFFADMVVKALEQSIYGAGVCDYSVAGISNLPNYTGHGLFGEGKDLKFQLGETLSGYHSTVTVHRLGEMIFPVTVEIIFEDGTKKIERWSGQERTKTYEYKTDLKVISAQIDPKQKIYLDIDFNNNSYTLEPSSTPLIKYSAKTVFWIQNIIQAVGFLL